MVNRQATYEEMKAALARAHELPPLERFHRMVRRGLIDKEGRLTKLYGGEAELDPEAIEYLKESEPEAIEYLKRQANGHPA
jgi:hypothetical protein